MSTRKPALAPPPHRRTATLGDLRKKPLFTQYLSFVLESIPEPKPPVATASAEERAQWLKDRAAWQEAVEAATREVKIQALPRRVFRELKEAHPATEAQVEEAKKKGESVPDVNEDTFAPALIAASIVEPADFTLEDARAIWEEWEDGTARLFYAGCLASNVSLERLDFYQKKSEATGG